LTVSPDTQVALGEHAKETNKYFMFNLSAPFLIDFFWDPMARVLPYTDVVFANETEAQTFGKKQGWGVSNSIGHVLISLGKH
jgi:adenosine kinase